MLYISFTTIPTRIGNISKVLDSISNQMLQPDKIIINIPKYCIRLKKFYNFKKIEKIIENSKLKDKVIINKTRDYGPITKIYPIIKLDFIKNDDMIIIIDDDIDYDKKKS